MSEAAAARPRCSCHDIPMQRNAGSGSGWRCAARENYRRSRRRRRKRIAEKRALLDGLESHAQENA